jgi:hypothetical protein
MPRTTKKIDAPGITVKPKSTRRVADRATRAGVTSNDIARLAYQIYEARGRTHGAHLDDWLEAERQLLNRA